jgi:tetratricopeptide (TPR) repeat protein
MLFLFCGTAMAELSPVEQFQQGNRYFEERQFDSALTTYLNLADQGMASAPLYFNTGNAYFRSGDLGRSVLYYLKAQRLDPSDPDIAGNLEFARRYTFVQMEGVELNPISALFASIVGPYKLNTLAWASSGCMFLLFAFLIARFGLGYSGSLTKSGAWLSLVLLVSASLLTTIKYDNDYLTRRAVVIAEESIVRTGPSELSDKELDGAPGLVVEILSESGDFYNVLF